MVRETLYHASHHRVLAYVDAGMTPMSEVAGTGHQTMSVVNWKRFQHCVHPKLHNCFNQCNEAGALV